MQTKRSFKFVLTELQKDEQAKPDQLCGKELYSSSCHYYTEKEIIEQIKQAEKLGGFALKAFQDRKFAIYKREKPKLMQKWHNNEETGYREQISWEIPGDIMLVETIQVKNYSIIID